jgi:predicted kinase
MLVTVGTQRTPSPIISTMAQRKRHARATDVERILKSLEPTPKDSSEGKSLVLTIGLPGSGKSTFCRRLRPLVNAVILESDALRHQRFGRPSYSASESRRLFQAIHGAARALLAEGSNVIVDATNLEEAHRRPLYAIAAEAQAKLVLLHFSADEEVIAARLEGRAQNRDSLDNSTAGYDVYQAMSGRLEAPLQQHFKIDTSDSIATEAVLSQVAEACRAGPSAAAGSAVMGRSGA